MKTQLNGMLPCWASFLFPYRPNRIIRFIESMVLLVLTQLAGLIQQYTRRSNFLK